MIYKPFGEFPLFLRSLAATGAGVVLDEKRKTLSFY